MPLSRNAAVLSVGVTNDVVRERLRAEFGSAVDLVNMPKHELTRTLEHRFQDVLRDEVTLELERNEPQFSARSVVTRTQGRALAVAGIVLLLSLAIVPSLAGVLLAGIVTAGYLANAVFRGWLFWVGSEGAEPHPDALLIDDPEDWPEYTILVPMYRESNVVPLIVAALRALDYPQARLDVKLVIEADDLDTLEAAYRATEHSSFEVLHVPVGEPRTKPRACNYALRFARGEFLVIYDAEDQPETDQLKKAVTAFRNAPADVACLQARLNFFNAKENWITRMFALDYGLWFDYLLPGLDRLGIPMPLGGTSNHFRVDALRAIHGWDPFNVTEDADLGIRLARLGFRVRTLDSTTYEEATNAFGNWLRQRTRWMKGYAQTWLVHMRSPPDLLRNAGVGGFFGFQLFVGGSVLSALLNPLLWLIFIASYFVPLPLFGLAWITGPLSAFGLVLGNALFAYLAMLGPYRRGWLELSPYGLTVPVYWLLISWAAYRALWQLVRNPWHWEKTAHGLTRMPTAIHAGEHS
ncbi:MAG TPA: glycosyltransferase [Rhizomicrobium sp.]